MQFITALGQVASYHNLHAGNCSVHWWRCSVGNGDHCTCWPASDDALAV